MDSEESVSSEEPTEALADETHILLKPFLAVRDSMVAFIVALGALLVVSGWTIDLIYTPATKDAPPGLPIAGIFGVLGVSILLFGVVIYVSLKAIGYN